MNSRIDWRLGLVTALALLGGCSEKAGHWEVIATVHAPVDSMVVDAEIATSDTLEISFHVYDLWWDTYSADHIRFLELERTRLADHVEYEVWIELLDWVGDLAMPPTETGFTHDHSELPPFEEGTFQIVVHQPDGGTLERNVTVTP